jgi:hypothetical protein
MSQKMAFCVWAETFRFKTVQHTKSLFTFVGCYPDICTYLYSFCAAGLNVVWWTGAVYVYKGNDWLIYYVICTCFDRIYGKHASEIKDMEQVA